ncbi:MAG TPA: YwqG family protein [Ktedonobacteraceae bacterium]|nr:YwqG family protein [Ktedonobacteraceae bacterium]
MNTPLQDLLRAAGLIRVSAEIEQVALPSIRLRAHAVDETQLKPGITRFGGAPDILPKWAWPEYHGSALPFVGQVNLAEIASYSIVSPLPDSGILSFFFDVDAFFETWPRDPATWKVEYIEHAPSESQHTILSEMRCSKSIYHPCTVTYSFEWTLPHYDPYDSTSLQQLSLSQPLTEEEMWAYFGLQATLAGREGTRYYTPIHRFLGHPDPVQVDMHADLEGETSEWLLLLQVDTDGAPHTDWGDTGRIYYWIRKQDALQRDFSQVQLILQCT